MNAEIGLPVAPADRLDRQMIAEMHAQNLSLSAISAHFDVSRERIRQIVKQLGLKPRLEVIAERNAKILSEAERSSSDEELAARFEISAAMVGLIRRQNGSSATETRRERLAAAMKRVSDDGISVRAAADEFGVSPGTLSSRLDEAGIKSGHGRWGALEHRHELIRGLIAENVGWQGILNKLSEVEKRRIASVTLRVWIKTHMPDINVNWLIRHTDD